MTEINPENNFGINSHHMIQPKKIIRKFNQIQNLVEIEPSDQEKLIESKL